GSGEFAKSGRLSCRDDRSSKILSRVLTCDWVLRLTMLRVSLFGTRLTLGSLSCYSFSSSCRYTTGPALPSRPIRDDEEAAASLGVRVGRLKFVLFVLPGSVAALRER